MLKNNNLFYVIFIQNTAKSIHYRFGDINWVLVGSGIFWIVSKTLVLPVEPPRRGFFRQKQHFPKLWTCPFSKNNGFRQRLDFWVIKNIKIGAKAQPGIRQYINWPSETCVSSIRVYLIFVVTGRLRSPGSPVIFCVRLPQKYRYPK